MKRFSVALGAVVLSGVFTAACGGGEQQTGQESGAEGVSVPAPGEPPTSPALSADAVDIMFTSQPDPPRTGENAFEVMVMSGTQPVTDAEVTVEFFMPAMPEMKMAEMRNSAPLKHQGGGRYSGTGNVMMAGEWDVTVRVRRGGQEIASREFDITAK